MSGIGGARMWRNELFGDSAGEVLPPRLIKGKGRLWIKNRKSKGLRAQGLVSLPFILTRRVRVSGCTRR